MWLHYRPGIYHFCLPDFLDQTFCFAKKDKSELQIFSQICKSLKKLSEIQVLSWAPVYLQYYGNVYISGNVKTELFTHNMWNVSLIACIRTDHKCIQDPFKHLERNFSQKWEDWFKAIWWCPNCNPAPYNGTFWICINLKDTWHIAWPFDHVVMRDHITN